MAVRAEVGRLPLLDVPARGRGGAEVEFRSTADAIAVAADVIILAAAAQERGPGIAGEEGSLREFWRFVAGGGAALSLVAVLWSALPVLLIEPCA